MYEWLRRQVDLDDQEALTEWEQREVTLKRRLLEIHQPQKDALGVLVCLPCSEYRPHLLEVVAAYAPCEHLALLAYTYAERAGYADIWLDGYAWDLATG